MSEDKRLDQVVPGVVVPTEITVPVGLPPEVTPSFPVAKVDPKAGLTPFVTPTPLAAVPSEHATIPPVASLGNGSTIVTLPDEFASAKEAEDSSGGKANDGSPDAGRVYVRQRDRAA